MSKWLSDQEVDRLLEQNKNEKGDVSGLLKQLAKQIVERALDGEMTHHLGFDKYQRTEKDNSRNGYSSKNIATPIGEIDVSIPRDRNGEFEPQLIPKGQRRLPEVDERILSLYARGLSTRDIQAHLKELYGIEISADLISTVTDSVVESVKEWQERPLESVYTAVYLDALWVKVRNGGKVVKKAVYLAIGVDVEGIRDILGFWIQQQEGASFWMAILDELKQRGVEDILIACVDGLKGFEQAIKAVFPKTEVQLCIVHLIRNSLRFVAYKDRSILVKDLRCIYSAINEESAKEALEAFIVKWDSKYPHVSKIWISNWDLITPCLSYPTELRRIIYTTNSIESVNKRLRKVLKTKGSFPSDQSIGKLLFLAITNITKEWTSPILAWKQINSQIEILFPERLPTKG
jgi:putative transposase